MSIAAERRGSDGFIRGHFEMSPTLFWISVVSLVGLTAVLVVMFL